MLPKSYRLANGCWNCADHCFTEECLTSGLSEELFCMCDVPESERPIFENEAICNGRAVKENYICDDWKE